MGICFVERILLFFFLDSPYASFTSFLSCVCSWPFVCVYVCVCCFCLYAYLLASMRMHVHVCVQLDSRFPSGVFLGHFHLIHRDSVIQPASGMACLCLQNAEISGWPPCPHGISVSARDWNSASQTCEAVVKHWKIFPSHFKNVN